MDETSYMTVAVSFDSDSSPAIAGPDVHVEAIEAVCESCKLRLTFRGGRTISQVFFRELRDEIVQKLAHFDEVDGLLSIPDYHFSCAMLSLRRLSIFGSEQANRQRVVTLRWSKVEGSIQSVLKECPDSLLPAQSKNAKLAFQVLNYLLDPIFDLTDTEYFPQEEINPSNAVKALINDFTAKRDELFKYARMLEIFLEHETCAHDISDNEDQEKPQIGSINQRYLC